MSASTISRPVTARDASARPSAARARNPAGPRRLARRSIPAIAAAGVVAVALPASPAAAQAGHSLTLTGPSTAVVGQPSTMQAAGTVPTDVLLNRYVNVYAIPTSVVATCPATFQSASQLAYNSSAQGGDTVALAVPATTDAAGSFSTPIAYTPAAAGQFLLCGYLHELVDTMAMASHAIGATAGGGTPPPSGDPVGGTPGAAKPANVRPPKVKRSGRKLVCKRGAWSGSPTGFAYHWTVDGKRRSGATGRKLRITRSLKGRKVRCGVTATNAAGTATTLSPKLRVR